MNKTEIMKKLFIYLCAMSFITEGFSQDIEIFEVDGTIDLSGTIFEVDANEPNPHKDFDIRNVSGATLSSVTVSRMKIVEMMGTQDYLCWGINEEIGDCYTPGSVSPHNPFVAPDRVNIPNGANAWLSSHHVPNGLAGCATYRYYILDELDVALDSVDVRYCGTLSLDKDVVDFSVYPNPVTDIVKVNITLMKDLMNHSFQLFDAAGRSLMSQTLVNGDNFIDLKSLPNGVYFYSIKRDDDILENKKLVVLH